MLKFGQSGNFFEVVNQFHFQIALLLSFTWYRVYNFKNLI